MWNCGKGRNKWLKTIKRLKEVGEIRQISQTMHIIGRKMTWFCVMSMSLLQCYSSYL